MKNSKNKNTLIIQVDDKKAGIYKNISTKELVKIIKKEAPHEVEKLKSTKKRIKAIHKSIIKDPDLTTEYSMLKFTQSKTDQLLNEELADMTNEERIKRIDEYHKYTSLGCALLFEHENYRGKVKFCTVTYPNLGWWPYRFNDKASSIIFWGFNVLCEHSWYQGEKVFFVGYPYGRFPRLSAFGFNDKASSYIG